MERSTGADDIRKRFRTVPAPGGIGGVLDPSTYDLGIDPSPLPLIPKDVGGQLGKNIILAATDTNPGGVSRRDLPLATRQSLLRQQSVSSLRIQPGLTGRQLLAPAGPPKQRSLFDVAGRFHDFQAGPRIARPNLAEEFIPVIGPAWDAAADLQEGHYGSAALNAAFAIGDILPVGYAIKAGKGVWKLGREMGTFVPKAAAIQRKLHKIGMALPTEDVHHVIALNGLGRYVPSLKNSPLFLKVLPREVHRRLHGRWAGQAKFGVLPRLWHSTTDWMKAGAAGAGNYAADGIENLEQYFSADAQTAR